MKSDTIVLMYHESRAVAGSKLAAELMDKYRYKDTALVALDHGGVAVGYQIATYLHTTLQQLLTETIRIDDESVDYATVMPEGVVAKNPNMSESESSYYYSEYAGQLDDEIREASTRINRMLGDGGDINPDILHGRNVILVSDGLSSGTILDAAVEWLKPVCAEKIILACPIISVDALDRAHILVDELHILGVTPNFISTDHYYDDNDEPDEEMVKRMINATILGWK
jgi:predicted phosphoribosyltransferase